EQDPPAARPQRIAGLAMERLEEPRADRRRRARVACRRTRAEEQRAVEDLGDLVLGCGEHVVVSRLALRLGHAGDATTHPSGVRAATRARHGTQDMVSRTAARHSPHAGTHTPWNPYGTRCGM